MGVEWLVVVLSSCDSTFESSRSVVKVDVGFTSWHVNEGLPNGIFNGEYSAT